MAATLLCRALHFRCVLPSPSRPLLPDASASSPTHRLLSTFTTTASQQNTATTTIDLSFDESRHGLIYRSKQREFLELDLVLGSWVEQHIHSMDEANIRALLQGP